MLILAQVSRGSTWYLGDIVSMFPSRFYIISMTDRRHVLPCVHDYWRENANVCSSKLWRAINQFSVSISTTSCWISFIVHNKSEFKLWPWAPTESKIVLIYRQIGYKAYLHNTSINVRNNCFQLLSSSFGSKNKSFSVGDIVFFYKPLRLVQ